jgi:hypothetical protein
LPQPVFTSSIHEHTYDTCIKLGLPVYVIFTILQQPCFSLFP